MDEQPLPAADVPVDQAPDAPPEHPGIEGTPSRWLVLAFVAMLSALLLISTTGIGAAAASLIGGSPYDCGGP